MPFGDRTGPMGLGPMTGRAAGFCAGFGAPGFANAGPGDPYYAYGYGRGYGRGIGRRAFGRGFGRGLGRGWRRWGPCGYPGW